jgi:hypothetical protein
MKSKHQQEKTIVEMLKDTSSEEGESGNQRDGIAGYLLSPSQQLKCKLNQGILPIWIAVLLGTKTVPRTQEGFTFVND